MQEACHEVEQEIGRLIEALESPGGSVGLQEDVVRRLKEELAERRLAEQRYAELYHREQQARAGAESARVAAEAALAALAESEARYRVMGETIPFGIWECGPDGGVHYLSPSFLDLIDMSLEEARGFGWTRSLPAEDVEPFMRRWMHCVETGQSWDGEHRIRDRHGDQRVVLTRGRPVRDEGGRITAWVGINLDITDRKRIEAELKEAEAANRAKDEFLAVLSHELRTPLTPVLATMSWLEAKGDLPAELRDEIASLRRNVEMEARLIDDLLDLTRIARGKIELHHEVMDAHAALRNALEICQTEIESKEIEVTLSLWAKRHHVWADPARMQQVFWNLIKNAAKFTPKGGRITLRTRNVAEGQGPGESKQGTAGAPPSLSHAPCPLPLVIEVVDTGIGIEGEAMGRIFKAFEQGDRATSRQFGGLGLGLTISKALVDMHGGRLTAISAGKGRGSSFTVELETMPVERERPVKPPAAVETNAKKGFRILLVEDHEDTLRIMAKLLRSFGYTVKTANTMTAALEVGGREDFDLLVSDLGLPDGSGLDVMRELKASKGLRGIALSGFGMDEDLRRSKEAGFEQHLVKPVNFQALESLIKRLAG